MFTYKYKIHESKHDVFYINTSKLYISVTYFHSDCKHYRLVEALKKYLGYKTSMVTSCRMCETGWGGWMASLMVVDEMMCGSG